MAAQLYSIALKGILTACPLVQTEREQPEKGGKREKERWRKGKEQRGVCANPISSDSTFRITVPVKEHIICQS